MSYHFNRWVITLGAQVHALHASMALKDAKRVRREAEAYEAELQELYTYAQHHHIELIAYYHAFAEIEDRLLLIYEHLQLRQANVR